MTEVIVRSDETPGDIIPPVAATVDEHGKQIETLGMLHVDDAVRTDTRFDELTDRLSRLEETMAAKGKPADPPVAPEPEPDAEPVKIDDPEIIEDVPDSEPDTTSDDPAEDVPDEIDPGIVPGEEGSPYAPGQNPFGEVERVEEEVVSTPTATKRTKKKTTVRENAPKAATRRSDKFRRLLIGGSGGVTARR